MTLISAYDGLIDCVFHHFFCFLFLHIITLRGTQGMFPVFRSVAECLALIPFWEHSCILEERFFPPTLYMTWGKELLSSIFTKQTVRHAAQSGCCCC